MSRRSRRNKRARQRRKYEQQKMALQLPPKRTVSTAEIFEMLKFQSHVLATVLAESPTKS